MSTKMAVNVRVTLSCWPDQESSATYTILIDAEKFANTNGISSRSNLITDDFPFEMIVKRAVAEYVGEYLLNEKRDEQRGY